MALRALRDDTGLLTALDLRHLAVVNHELHDAVAEVAHL
jgi:hypothetical protein